MNRKRWSSDRKALARIARKPKYRERWLYTSGTILLVDDGGGEAITSFSELAALHYFLMWFRHRKAELQAEEKILQRRGGFLVVDGGGVQ